MFEDIIKKLLKCFNTGCIGYDKDQPTNCKTLPDDMICNCSGYIDEEMFKKILEKNVG